MLTLDTTSLDLDGGRGPPVAPTPNLWTDVDGPVSKLFLTRDGERLLVVLAPGADGTQPGRNAVAIFDTVGITELARPSLPGVDAGHGPIPGRQHRPRHEQTASR